MINNVVLMGRICQDIELKTTNSGVNVVSFALAVERNFKTNGEKQTDFINIVAWRSTADFISNYFSKGQMIAVQGSIQTRRYEDKQGNNRTAFEVVANQVSFCGGKNESNNSTATNNSLSVDNTDDFDMIDGDDELPF